MKGKTTRKRTAHQRSAIPATSFHVRAERLAAGNAIRDRVPRKNHGAWRLAARDPIQILKRSNAGRVQDLVPIRYGRMLRSPFTFFRGSAGLMAYDLSKTATTGIRVQACGDCHLLNFGMFATPERNLVFDINDFDETLPAPWEWDVKRLAASFAIAARSIDLKDGQARDVVAMCAASYRENLREYSRMTPLEVWYAQMDVEALIKNAPDTTAKKHRREMARAARERVIENLFPKITTEAGGRPRLVDQPPLIYHVAEKDAEERVQEGLAAYKQSLADERRVLFDRYRLEDFAMKVVGIGSVGTRCFIALFFSEDNHPLILQFKEANQSVLEPYAGKSVYPNHGQRVVVGQRLMQSSSDIFLGWARGRRGYEYYIRQLRDMKMSASVDEFSTVQLERYADLCGSILARAHAKSGDAATISGYLGKSDSFDQAMAAFAVGYADQTEKDYAALKKAARSGKVKVLDEEA
jgi:uncharacterized protein (DUF2252 family)